MKNIVLLTLIAIIIVACNNEKNSKNKKLEEATPKKELVFKNISLPDFSLWDNVRTEMTKSKEIYQKIESYKLERKTNKESAFLRVNSIDIDSAGVYKVSLIAKRGKDSNLFGLRMSGKYPKRIDAVFDLEKGVVVGNTKTKEFTNEKISIQSMGNQWYKCTIEVKANIDAIKLIFGPANSNSIGAWEGKSNQKLNLFIVPNSLMLEKLSY